MDAPLDLCVSLLKKTMNNYCTKVNEYVFKNKKKELFSVQEYYILEHGHYLDMRAVMLQVANMIKYVASMTERIFLWLENIFLVHMHSISSRVSCL